MRYEERRWVRLAVRAVLGMLVVTGFLLGRDSLDPRTLVTARLALGVALLALLVDAARVFVGARDPVHGDVAPHEQRAEPLVDERYERVHEPVTRYVDEGVWTRAYTSVLQEAFEAVDAPPEDRERAIDEARQAAEHPRPAGEPLGASLVAGLLVTAGATLAIATLLDVAGLPAFGPALVVAGLGLGATQLRTRRTGSRWLSLALGVAGAASVAVGALQTSVAYAGPWSLVAALAAIMLAASVALTWLGEASPPPWPTLATRLEDRLTALRRAFLLVLLAGGVLFPLKPLLEGLAGAAGVPFDGAYRVAVILYATLAGYLAVEMTGTWYGLDRGRRRAREHRQARVDANEAILDLLDDHAPRAEEAPR